MSEIIFDKIVECPSCGGTGLYQGFAEKDGAAVVCCSCDGTGSKRVVHRYKDFSGIRRRPKVERVYKTAGGFGITSEACNGIRFDLAGCSYDDWLKGEEPKPIKDLHCPLLHYQQGTNEGEHLKRSGPCKEYLSIGGSIVACCRKHRADCWVWVDINGVSK